ncbi:hypothetical protein IV203_017282 [Nitzschia inconspicua]|uniref:Uncharacterized protein n=1 Tax=Nitzschia inconspicua TaxID=303405 RepID=A0A9K3KS87_9STRA|nr:hypothetical protein IV203_017282 [Nitzschia inconspicua]
MTPSVCGGFLTDKRSMVAFTWSITTVLTLFAFITAVILTIQVHTHYRRLRNYYEGDDWYQQNDNNYYNNNNQEGEGEGGQPSRDEQQYEQIRESYQLLESMSAKSITFVAVYTMMLSTALSLYGSMAIVGFTSLRGVYIAPCFSSGGNKLRVGIFGGAIVIFANLLLVCAVILGEVKVADYNDRPEEEKPEGEMEPYQVERIATILAVTCMFLSALYTVFAVLLFLCHAGEEKSLLRYSGDGVHHDGTPGVGVSHNKTPLVGVTAHAGVGTSMGESHHHHHHHHHTQHTTTALGDSPGFITMDNSSQGTSE